MKKKDTRLKKKVFVLEVTPYSQQCIVVCNGQFSDAVKVFKKANSANSLAIIKHIEENKDVYVDDYKPGTKSGYLYTELPTGYVMMISYENHWVDTVGVVTHECLHLVHYVLMRAGIKLAKESEEAFTYLHQHLVEEVLSTIFRKR